MKLPISLFDRCRGLLLTAMTVCLCSGVGHAQTDTIIRAGRWTSTATNGNTGPLGTPVTLTWSIARDGQDFTFIGVTPSDLVSFLDTRWSTSGPATSFETRRWFGPLKQGFDRWGEVSGLTYVYEPNDSGSFGANGALGIRGDIRVGGFDLGGPGGVIAVNFFPNSGEMVFDTTETVALDPDDSISNRGFRNIVSHEHGHGLGLEHIIDDVPGETFLLNPELSIAFDGPQFHDILAVQRGYGDPLEKNGGNDTLANATPLGAIASGASAGIGFDTPDLGGDPTGISIDQTDFISIDDNSDTDFFQFSVDDPSAVTIVLNPRGPSYGAVIQGNPQLPTSEFNASEQSDLVLAVFDQNGTLLAEFDDGGVGGEEIGSNLSLSEAGDYFVRVTGKANAIQMYSLEVTSGVGDVNMDGVVNFLDISPFITILSAGGFQEEADIDQNGFVNFLDIAPFIGILSGS